MREFFCTFLVGGLLFGINVTQVQEVLPLERLTTVPLAPRAIAGIVNLRGQLVTAVDLRHRLGLSPRAGDASFMQVVLRSDSDVIGLLVDAVGDVVEVDSTAFEPPREPLSSAVRNLVAATCPLPNRLLLVLDTKRTLEVEY